ncbi:MAG: ABC transporter permease [Pseudomonadota bacterium]
MRLELVFENLGLFGEGVLMTLELAAIALIIGFALALPMGLAIYRKTPVAAAASKGFIYVFRGTPLLVQAYLIYYGLSQFEAVRDSIFWQAPDLIRGTILGEAWPSLRSAWWCAVIAFSLNSAAYQAAILAGAFEAVPRGVLEGGRAVGLSERLITRLVLLPTALRQALPQYSNEVVFMLHGTAVAGVITLQDILGAGRTLNARYYVAYEGYLTAAFLYMAITGCLVVAFKLIEKRAMRHLARPAAATEETTGPARPRLLAVLR